MRYICPKCGEQVCFFIEQSIEYKRLVNIETGKLEAETKTDIKKSYYLFDDYGVRRSNRYCDWSESLFDNEEIMGDLEGTRDFVDNFDKLSPYQDSDN